MDENGISFSKALRTWWIISVATILAASAIIDLRWLHAYLNINWPLFAVEAVAMPFVIAGGLALYKLNPRVMGFGFVRIINRLMGKRQRYFRDGTPELEVTNINLIGTDIKYFGILMCLLLLTALPSLAELEEGWFRAGTTDWWDAIVRSIAFGLVHMIVGVPVVGAVVITFVGLFCTYLYFQGGLPLAIQGHFQYDLILVSLLLLIVTLYSFVPSRK